ncbi:hypothetical protein GCM10023066_25330 [Nocardioides kongjuensis]
MRPDGRGTPQPPEEVGMGRRTVCDENYPERRTARTTGGHLLALLRARRVLLRLILGELWEGRTRTG